MYRISRRVVPVAVALAFVSAVVLLPLTAAPAAANTGDGTMPGPRLVKTPAREAVWLVHGGHRQWIADLGTFSARGYRWDAVEVIAPAALHALPLAPADHIGPLVRDVTTGNIYLVADGQARLIPDLLSFQAYGLDWRRVEPAPPGALAGRTRGAALPHAVAGRSFPDLPPRTGAPRGDPFAGLDARLQAALDLIAAYPPTAEWPAFLRERGVAMRFGPVAGGHASYRAAGRTLTVADALRDADPRTIATVVVHETVHAIYDARGQSGMAGRACVDEEAHAFAVQSAFWAHHHGLSGLPDPSTEVERDLNRALFWAQDDALFGKMLTTWTYTVRCYFPGLGGTLEE